jgi:integrase
MPRKVRDANLETRTARSRLPVRHKPVYRLVEPGLHLGYRKLPNGPGTWIARRYSGQGRYAVENLRTTDGEIVLADDYEDADGHRVMTFAQAQRAARGPRRATGGLTVGEVVAQYLAYLDSDGRSRQAVQDARYKLEAHVLPRLGNVKIAALSADRLRHWRDGLASTAARVRTRQGEPQRHREAADSEDGRRARKASINRVATVLRAALNHAFQDGKIESDAAWRKVRPFKQVEAARLQYLTVAESRRLINASDPDFRLLVQAALATGCRYGELARLTVADFNDTAGTIAIRRSKSGKARHVVLTDEGTRLFATLAAGRSGSEVLLRKSSGKPWGIGHQKRPMREACSVAKIVPAISFHILRHTWASLAVMGGVSLMVVARNLGHVDSRMVEKHYGHLAPSYVADEIRKGAPTFGFRRDQKVATLR